MGEFLYQLLVATTIATVVPIVNSLIQTVKAQLIFGFSVLALGVAVLIFGYTYPRPAVSDYTVERVVFRDCDLDKEKSAVRLKDGQRTFFIERRLIGKVTTQENALDVICNAPDVKIWFRGDGPEKYTVRGFETDDLRVPIETGMEIDDQSSAIYWLGALFGGLGLLIVVLAILFKDHAKLKG